MKKENTNWEKEFDQNFTPHNPKINTFGWSKQDMNGVEQVRQFIRSLLSSERQRLKGEIEKMEGRFYGCITHRGNTKDNVCDVCLVSKEKNEERKSILSDILKLLG